MSRTSFASLLALSAVLAACSTTNTDRSITAPDVSPSFTESSADIRGSLEYDGPSDLVLTPANSSLQMAAAAPNAASGGRASGHVLLTFNPPAFGLQSFEYSFTALRTDPNTPFAAKGQYDLLSVTASGAVQEIHGSVICMNIVGNTAFVAGQITSVVVNGIPRPLNGVQTHNAWTVTDNGEGTPDNVSIAPFFPIGGALFHCNTGWIIPSGANEAGNIQVR
jgi:hypothetical protein